MRALLILVLLAMIPTFAAQAEPACQRSPPPILDTGATAAGQYYATLDFSAIDGWPLGSVYQESNGIRGLQRWDKFYDDTCGGEIEGDFDII